MPSRGIAVLVSAAIVSALVASAPPAQAEPGPDGQEQGLPAPVPQAEAPDDYIPFVSAATSLKREIAAGTARDRAARAWELYWADADPRPDRETDWELNRGNVERAAGVINKSFAVGELAAVPVEPMLIIPSAGAGTAALLVDQLRWGRATARDGGHYGPAAAEADGQMTGEWAGSVIGAAAGGTAGAAAGALLGSPWIGYVAGEGAGAVAGSFAGNYVGGEIGTYWRAAGEDPGAAPPGPDVAAPPGPDAAAVPGDGELKQIAPPSALDAPGPWTVPAG